MSGRPPQPQPQDFNPPGRVLFRLTFNVDGATAADFNQFMERVQQEISIRIQRPRYYGTRGTMLLPCPQTQQLTWFIIILESRRDRETRYSVPFFIEAETIYLHGYQNYAGYLFEFALNPDQDPPPSGSYLGRDASGRHASTRLSFSCNYHPLVQATGHKGPKGKVLDRGLTLQEGTGTPMPDFSKERLQTAVRELGQGDNSGSQHRTAQNLLLVIIRFCESIRFRSVRREMVNLWNSAGTSISSLGVSQIHNWNRMATNLQESGRKAIIWREDLSTDTGVGTPTEAADILVVIKFNGDPNEPGNPSPQWGNAPPDNHRRQGGGPGPGPGGAAGGVLAAEMPRWLRMPEEPVMQILGIDIPRQRGGGGLEGVYGSITVTDGLGTQMVYGRSREYFQRNSSDSEMRLELEALNRAISAYDCVDVDFDLNSVSPTAPLTVGNFSWSANNCRTNRYDHVVRRTIGRAVLEYIVYSKAVQVAVSITVDRGDGVAHAWFTTMNTMVGVLQPGPRRYMTTRAGGRLHGDYVVAVPLSARLEVIATVEHKGSRQPVGRTFELQPTGDGGMSTRTETLPQGTTVKVDFAWNLLRMGLPPSATSSAGGNRHDELRRRR